MKVVTTAQYRKILDTIRKVNVSRSQDLVLITPPTYAAVLIALKTNSCVILKIKHIQQQTT